MPAERLDTEDLDAEDLAALAEVSRKGYYHARPRSEAAPAPERVDGPAATAAAAKRVEFDGFQKKWDKFDHDEPDVVSSSSAARVAPARPAAAAVPPAPPKQPQADDAVVAQLVAMGFEPEECQAAAIATNNRSDAAIDYILSGKAKPAATPSAASQEADPAKLSRLVEMGMPEQRAREALQFCRNDLDRALERCCVVADALAVQGKTLRQLELDVAALEADSSEPDAKRLRSLEETVMQTSCNLDSVAVDDDDALRSERRVHLDLCNALDARIVALRRRGPRSGAVPRGPEDSRLGVAPAEAAAPNAAAGAAAAEPAACSESQERIAEAERLRVGGNESFKAQDYAAAVKAYRGALELDAENVAILSNLAAAEIKLGDFAEAAAHSDVANELSGGFSAKALFRKGQALEGLNQHKEAAEAFGAALAIEPSDKQIKQRLKACREEVALAAAEGTYAPAPAGTSELAAEPSPVFTKAD